MKKTLTILLFFIFSSFGVVLSQTNAEHGEVKEIKIGFSKILFDNVDSRDAEVSIKMWGKELIKYNLLNLSLTTIVYEAENEMIEALNNRQIDLISLPIVDYLRIRDRVNIKPSVINSIDNRPGHNLVLVVRKDKQLNKIEDLKNKSINLSTNSYGFLAEMWIATEINSKLDNYNTFFSEVNKLDKPAQVMLPVFFKQADACILPKQSYRTLIELNPQLQNELVVIKESPVFVNSIMCWNYSMDKSLIEPLLLAISNIPNTGSGKQILTLFKSDGIIEYDEKYLEETEKIFNKYNLIKKN